MESSPRMRQSRVLTNIIGCLGHVTLAWTLCHRCINKMSGDGWFIAKAHGMSSWSLASTRSNISWCILRGKAWPNAFANGGSRSCNKLMELWKIIIRNLKCYACNGKTQTDWFIPIAMIWLFKETTLSPNMATGSGDISVHLSYPDMNAEAEEVIWLWSPVIPPTTRYT